MEPVKSSLVTASLPQSLGKPFQTFIQTVTGGGASGLNVLGIGLAGVAVNMEKDIPRHGVSSSADPAAG